MYSFVKDRLTTLALQGISARALQQGTLLLAASLAGNVLQYLFHFFASRLLGPAEYGVFTALLGLSVILTVPAGIAQTVITQYASRFYARGEMHRVAALFADSLAKLTAATLVAFGLVILASPWIAGLLNIPSLVPVVGMASMLLFTGPFTAMIGSLQGLQRFNFVAGQLVLGPGFRLVMGILLVSLGWGAGGALGATTISNLFIVAIGWSFVRDLWGTRRKEHGLTLSEISPFGGLVFVGTLALTILTNMDLVIVKHYFTAAEAGYYAAASVLGKVILFIPGAIATLMFPKTAYRHARGESAMDLGRKSLLAAAALCGLAAGVLALFPMFAVRLLFGEAYAPSIPLVGLYGATMGLYALVQLLLAFYISQAEARFAWLLVAVTGALAVWLVIFHASLMQVIVALAAAAIVILVGSEMWLNGLGLARRVKAVST